MDGGGPLQRPPGYRDANAPPPQPAVRPPQRKPGIPTGYKPEKERRSSCCVCCCCCCGFFFILIILLAAFAAVFYLWFKPQPPTFALQSFQVKKFEVASKSRDGTTSLDAQTTSRVEVGNPNSKITFYYGATEVSVRVGENGESGLGSTTVPEFSEGPESKTSLKVDTAVAEEAVANAVVLKLRDDYKSKALVLKVEVATSFGVGFWGLKIGMFKVDVKCGGMTMKEVESGGAKPKCKVYVLDGYATYLME